MASARPRSACLVHILIHRPRSVALLPARVRAPSTDSIARATWSTRSPTYLTPSLRRLRDDPATAEISARADAVSWSWIERLIETNPTTRAPPPRRRHARGDRPRLHRHASASPPEDTTCRAPLPSPTSAGGRPAGQQIRLLEGPQAEAVRREVREYVAHRTPGSPADEVYARPLDRFPKSMAAKRPDGLNPPPLVDLRSPPCSRTAWRAASIRSCSSRSPTRRRRGAPSMASASRPTARWVQLRGAKIHRKNGAIDEIEAAKGRDRRSIDGDVLVRNAFYIRFPRASIRATSSSSSTARRDVCTAPHATRSRTTGEVRHMQTSGRSVHAGVRADRTPQGAHVYLTSPTSPASSRRRRTEATLKICAAAENVPRSTGAERAAVRKGTPGHVHVDVPGLERDGPVFAGASSGPVHAG